MATPMFRDKLLAALGGPWPDKHDLNVKVLSREQKDGYRLEKVQYEPEAGDTIPAYVLVPDGVTPQNPAATVCIWHQHAGQYHLGKSEPAGMDGAQMHHTGVGLAQEGFVVVCPDAVGFEERVKPYECLRGGDLERHIFLKYVVAGKSMAWKNILDMKRTVDYAVSRPEVDAENIGCYGHSMGSTHAWLVGPWDPRIKALVGNCCLPTYAAIHRTELLHCFPSFIPGLYQYGDTPDICGLIAPRPLHMNFGDKDSGSPIKEVREGIATIKQAYDAVHAKGRFTSFIQEDTGHVLSPEMWELTLAFFNRYLRG